MKCIRIFTRKLSVYGGEIFNIFRRHVFKIMRISMINVIK